MTLHLSLVPPPRDALLVTQVAVLKCAIQLMDSVLETSDDARLTLHLGHAIDSAEMAVERLS